ncbi:type 1 fimbrial major subunit FimA [Enterobacter mori]|uniref:type 1 fimbrial major subunit FimA n=1 Tax=Enterobacter mori TaxID=539813 RepID=UPI002A838309|nr:type 1 fimbrial major subunit FimA [Enterobacter mori]
MVKLFSIALGMMLFSAVASAASTTVQGGTVHFKGQIVNASCSVSAESSDQTVNLGQYKSSLFTSVGVRSGAIPFNIVLNDCDTLVAQSASVAFSGAVDANDPTVLSTSNLGGGAGGAAAGVGIEISDKQGTVLTPDGSTFSAPNTLITGTNTLIFNARYKSTAAIVTPGEADADATFVMQYQ